VRASTFFALFIAVLLGFAALASARYFRLFETAPPQTVVAPPRIENPKILVARKNLFEGMAMSSSDVQVRELRDDEMSGYLKNPGQYMPATVEAATLRVVNKNLPAGTIMMTDYLEPQAIPQGLPGRITPGMRAINVSVPRERASGGLIRRDDYVDVFLTTNISADKNNPTGNSRTACLARNVCVILKRDLLWNVLAAVPAGKPLQFTLEANPYRAALIDFAQNRGQLTLVPTPIPPRAPDAKLVAAKTFDIPDSKEYANEDERVAAIQLGDRSVGNADLERIFGLPPIPIVETLQVEILNGNKVKGVSQFNRVVAQADRRSIDADQPGFGYQFNSPPAPATEVAPEIKPFARPISKNK